MSESALEQLLARSGSRRIPLATLRAEFARERPELASSGTFRERLRTRLDELATSGLIRFPASNGNSWDKVGTPLLPKWIQLRDVKKPARIDTGAIAWLPIMAFAQKLRRPSDVKAATTLNEFLVRHRHDLKLVPVKERSLQIFGDEKAIDRRCNRGALFGGQLTLESIGAFDPAPPLPYESISTPGLPLLLLENHHTYWSFSTWNSQARRYSAVVYGAGWVISRCGAALTAVLKQTGGTHIEYFGDVDPTGIRIALKLAAQISAAEVPPLRPAGKFYAWTFKHGVRTRLTRSPTRAQGDEARSWLPRSLHTHLEVLYESGLRIPQECIGLDVLKTWGDEDEIVS